MRALRELFQIAGVAACAVTLLTGASCKKESKAQTDTGAIKAADDADKAKVKEDPKKPVDTTPVEGIDVAKLDEGKQKMFFRLVDSFSSPCGKAHSLRTSVKEDPECKRAPFAARYLAAMIEDELSEEDVRMLWEAKYKAKHEPKTFRLDGVPRSGSDAAPIKIVEFYDYGCPSCQATKPIIDAVAAENASTTAVYYKQFPLTDKHPNSMSAAQAALAAHAQGKFHEMHDVLFAKAPAHKRADVMRYARELGLDMTKFETDYDAAEELVRAEMKEGDEAGVDGTPSIFFNGRPYEGPAHQRYFGYWIQEELGVNR